MPGKQYKDLCINNIHVYKYMGLFPAGPPSRLVTSPVNKIIRCAMENRLKSDSTDEQHKKIVPASIEVNLVGPLR